MVKLSLLFFHQHFLPQVCHVIAPCEFCASQLCQFVFAPNHAPTQVSCSPHFNDCPPSFSLVFLNVDCYAQMLVRSYQLFGDTCSSCVHFMADIQGSMDSGFIRRRSLVFLPTISDPTLLAFTSELSFHWSTVWISHIAMEVG